MYLLDFARGDQQNAIPNANPHVSRGSNANQNALAVQVELTLHNTFGNDINPGGVFRIDCPQVIRCIIRVLTFRLSSQKNILLNVGGNRKHVRVRGRLFSEFAIILQLLARIQTRDLQMRIKPENFISQFPIEPRHDTDHDDQHCHPQHHADNGNQRNNGHESAFGPEIPERELQFKWQARHASYCFASILAQASLSVTVRLKTGLPATESFGSTKKYPVRSN